MLIIINPIKTANLELTKLIKELQSEMIQYFLQQVFQSSRHCSSCDLLVLIKKVFIVYWF